MTRKPKCSVPQCSRDQTNLGYCGAHAQRLRQYGDVKADQPIRERGGKLPAICTVAGCRRKAVAKQYCKCHYYRARLHDGNAFPHIPIQNNGRPLKGRNND
jgi:hypothetical protein